MKKILDSRKTAFIVLIAVILIFTPIGVVRSLNSVADSVEDMFTDGVELSEDGSIATSGTTYTSASIQSLLDSEAKNALGLITVGAAYDAADDETAELRAAREDLIGTSDISELGVAHTRLCSAADALYEKLSELELSSTDRVNADDYYENITQIAGSISINKYNDVVTEFYEVTLSRFPANLFASLVSGPQYFGE